jgi:predicted adenine nucleotide alpha hydrolase (AANH) superfamily ATPase
VTLFFSNANLVPETEWQKRLEAVYVLAKHDSIPVIEDETSHSDWLASVAAGFEQEPERGKRCERCFRYSLMRTYEATLEKRFDGFTTSLTVSPHKLSTQIFHVGQLISQSLFLDIDFKKHDGFKHSLQRSEELGLYRQSNCGCEFSVR